MPPLSLLLGLALGAAASGSPPEAAGSPPLRPLLEEGSPWLYEATCANGLPLVLERRAGTGTAYIRIGVRVGSRDEASGEEGLAHLLEHMLFKEGHGAGGPRNAGFEALRRAGALVNASTD